MRTALRIPFFLFAVIALLGANLVAAPTLPRKRVDARIELGRRLFLDPAVSQAGRFSCASCHLPEHGFSDPRRVSIDENGETRRHSQPITDLIDGKGMHWDGEFDRVRELLVARLHTPATTLAQTGEILTRHMSASLGRGEDPDRSRFGKRMQELTPPYYGPKTPTTPGTPPTVTVAERLQQQNHYGVGFRKAFGDAKITNERVIDAMEVYILSLESGPSPFDRYAAGEPEAMAAPARRGLALFSGKANCASCHSLGGTGARAPFADGEFHNTGVAFRTAEIAMGRTVTGDGGYGDQSFVTKDLGSFKTPSLRNVALRPPYMHDGSMKSLEEVVRYYDVGGTRNLNLDRAIRPLRLSDEEVADLVAFMDALTSERRPGLGDFAEHRPSQTRVRIVDLNDRPIRDLEVEIVPAGDRLGDRRGVELPQVLTTDRMGEITFTFPDWTHVLIRAESHEIGLDRPLPDYVASTKLLAAPRDSILLRVVSGDDRGSLPATISFTLTGGYGVEFKRARRVSSHAAYYRAALPKATVGWVTGSLDGLAVSIDLAGGEAEPIQLPSNG